MQLEPMYEFHWRVSSEIAIHSRCFSRLLTYISASLARLEQTIAQAIEDDEQAMAALETSGARDSDLLVSPRSIRGSLSRELEQASEDDTRRPDNLHVPPLRPANLKQGNSRPRHTSISSESIVSGSDGSFNGGTAPTSPTSLNTTRSASQGMMGRISHSRTRSEQPYEGSIDSRAHEKIFWEDNSDIQDRQSTMEKSSESSQVDYGHNRVLEAVASAMQQLRQVRLKEQLARPIRYERQNMVHTPNPELLKIFETSVNEELQVRRLITRDWLRVATWWLLKARATLANCGRHNYVSARGSLSPSTDSQLISHQAYIDLLKASYILYDVVLKDENSPALLTDENRKSIVELSEVLSSPF